MGHVATFVAIGAAFVLGCKPRPTSTEVMQAAASPDLERDEQERSDI